MIGQQLAASHPKYRPDIDGLRAFAVLAVVAFHAFPSWVGGGFIGVDIFFVISGYLITTIILDGLDRGTFSFAEFFSRRIRRIFPALLLVLIACFAFGWIALMAGEYKQLGKHIAAGAGFISNFVLWSESGYFDNSSETKPLLHLWSLGIEEQFYILWPLLLWFAWKQKFNLLTITLVVTITSFILNFKGVKQDVIAAFYAPQTRFWELLTGSLLAYFSLYKKEAFANIKSKVSDWFSHIIYGDHQAVDTKILTNMLSFVGLFFLLYGFWRFNKELSFPGTWALLPVLGTVLIVAAGSESWVNRTILSNRIAVWFGLISFPLYLWHWPLLSFARIVESGVPSRNIRIISLIFAIFLAWLTYKLVERPFRIGKYNKAKVTVLVTLMTVIGYTGYNTYIRDGLSFRNKERERFVSRFEATYPSWTLFKAINLPDVWRLECGFFNINEYLNKGSTNGGINSKPINHLASYCYKKDVNLEKSVLVWGDSHAQALIPGLLKFMPNNWQILQIASFGCTPKPDEEQPSIDDHCRQTNYFAIETIKNIIPDVVIVAQNAGHSTTDMKVISQQLKNYGVKKTVFLGPTPHWTTDLPKIIARQLWLTKPKRTFVGIDRAFISRNQQLLREFVPDDSTVLVDVIGFFCNAEGCLTHTGHNIEDSITTWDNAHLMPNASLYLAQHLLVETIIKD